MKRLSALIPLFLACYGLLSQNRLFRDMSALEKADYFMDIAENPSNTSELYQAVDSAAAYYLVFLNEADSIDCDQKIWTYYRLSLCYTRRAKFDKADIFLKLIIKSISDNRCGLKPYQYARGLLYIANIYSIKGDISKAAKFLKFSHDEFKRGNETFHTGKDTSYMIDFLQTRMNIKLSQQKFKSARKDAKHKVRLAEKYYGKNNDTYLSSVLKLSRLYNELGQHISAANWSAKAYSSYTDRIVQRFGVMSDEERSRYWMSASEYFKQMAAGESYPEIAYNSILFAKGILLNTTIEYNKFIKEHADSSIYADYNKMNKLIASGGERAEIDSLDQTIMDKLKDNGTYFRPASLSVTWEQVRDCLADDDLAIEFINTENGYSCILLKKKWNKPRYIAPFLKYNYYGLPDILYNKLEDNSLYTNNIERIVSNLQSSKKLGKKIWIKKIRRHFPKTDEGRIFFSPDGKLDFIGIEYLPLAGSKNSPDNEIYCLADIYPVYRLSSTRELLYKNKPADSLLTIGLYGSPDFGAKEKLKEAHDLAAAGARRLTDMRYERRLKELPNYGGELPPLKDAMREVHAIDSIMTDVGYSAHIFTGANASEDVFKIASADENLIHLATHGFYLTPFASMLKQSILSPEAVYDPLYRCGLFMAGARNTWIRGEGLDNLENGILTANEISTMDLGKVDMVILSACQTGLGDIGQDGTYGLQRAFKIAGARSIIVSLWKISDEATAFMMKNFYQNRYLLHMSKYDAFKAAQRLMRNTREWKSPKYWGAFVLIDPDI